MKAVCKWWVLSAYNPFQKGNTIVLYIVVYCSDWEISLKVNKLGFPFCRFFSLQPLNRPVFSIQSNTALSHARKYISLKKTSKYIPPKENICIIIMKSLIFFNNFGTSGSFCSCWQVVGPRCRIGVGSYFLSPQKCSLWHYTRMRSVCLVSLSAIWGQSNNMYSYLLRQAFAMGHTNKMTPETAEAWHWPLLKHLLLYPLEHTAVAWPRTSVAWAKERGRGRAK